VLRTFRTVSHSTSVNTASSRSYAGGSGLELCRFPRRHLSGNSMTARAMMFDNYYDDSNLRSR